MEPALHVVSTRLGHERSELTPGGRTMARELGLPLLAGASLLLWWLVLAHAAGARDADVLAAVFGRRALAARLWSGRVGGHPIGCGVSGPSSW
jgi:hypothetical protein